jgi:hypothetical protein
MAKKLGGGLDKKARMAKYGNPAAPSQGAPTLGSSEGVNSTGQMKNKNLFGRSDNEKSAIAQLKAAAGRGMKSMMTRKKLPSDMKATPRGLN